jgi:hypothetical protein
MLIKNTSALHQGCLLCFECTPAATPPQPRQQQSNQGMCETHLVLQLDGEVDVLLQAGSAIEGRARLLLHCISTLQVKQ